MALPAGFGVILWCLVAGAPSLACGGGGSGSYRKPLRPPSHSQAVTASPQAAAGAAEASSGSAPSGSH